MFEQGNLDHLDFDYLAQKVGGKFKLTALMQKRLKEMVLSGETLGSVGASAALKRVVEEIETGQISLVDESVYRDHLQQMFRATLAEDDDAGGGMMDDGGDAGDAGD